MFGDLTPISHGAILPFFGHLTFYVSVQLLFRSSMTLTSRAKLFSLMVRPKEQRKPNNSAEFLSVTEIRLPLKGSRSPFLKIRLRFNRSRIPSRKFGLNRIIRPNFGFVQPLVSQNRNTLLIRTFMNQNGVGGIQVQL